MSESQASKEPEETIEGLRARTAELARALAEAETKAQERLLRAELKAEAVKAGMIDLDGLKLIDTDNLRLNEAGEVEGAAVLMARFKREKPWLFSGASSSTAAAAPQVSPPRAKYATEMTEAEWRAARAELLRRR